MRLSVLAALALTLAACRTPPPVVTPSITASVDPIQQLHDDIDTMLAAPALERGLWGVLVKSLTADDTLYAVNAQKLFMPASNMKVVTLAAVADRLGWDYTYETRVLGLGAIAAGVLEGDLLVVGSGDPSVVDGDGSAARLFATWAERLKALGVRTIRGRLIGDDDTFDDEGLGSGWTWDDLSAGYAAPVGALQYNENQVRVAIGPGPSEGTAATVSIAPPGSGLMLVNLVTTAAADRAASIDARRLPGSTRLELRGAVPAAGLPIVRALSVDNPTQFFVTALRDALLANGIDVTGGAVDIDDLDHRPSRDEGTPLITHRSPPLSQLATVLMKGSLNVDAETMLKTLGLAAGAPTSAMGRATTRSIVERWGVPASALIMADGSGLSRYNYVTPAALVTILTHIDRDARLRDAFEATLPIAGVDGTLARRMNDTPAEGNARAKTGSLANARALSGYVRTADGEPLVFSILANNFEGPASTIEATADAIVVRLARFSRR